MCPLNLGVRTHTVDPQKGFFPQRRSRRCAACPAIRTVWSEGNALTKEQHEEDVAFIREVGREHRAPCALPAQPVFL